MFFSFILRMLDWFKPLGDLAARIWISEIFFRAGVLKLMSWNSTIMLFAHEFQVPFLSPYVAAVIGTTAELILPVLLVLGLGSRIMIAVFFAYNAIAVISYPELWCSGFSAGLGDHLNWGLLLAMLMFHGPGKISLDYLIMKKWGTSGDIKHNV